MLKLVTFQPKANQGGVDGQVVTVLAIYSYNPSLNPAEVNYNVFLVKLFIKNKNKRKRGGEAPFKKLNHGDPKLFFDLFLSAINILGTHRVVGIVVSNNINNIVFAN